MAALSRRNVRQIEKLKSDSKLKISCVSHTHLRISAIASVAMAAIVAISVLNSGCSRGTPDQAGFGAAEIVPVLAAKVVQKNVAESISAIGRVEAFSTVDIKA